ncbi:class I SAM-dependent methyltransferase, partial [Mycolicibacterium brisbanense]|uniref:class I SAM-dependent methyltransferase n=1 Tax=Mycolicibacterium brisbanense TaxID=146020 RepID=UPI0021F2C5B1
PARHYLAVFADHKEVPLYLGRSKRLASVGQRPVQPRPSHPLGRPRHRRPDWPGAAPRQRMCEQIAVRTRFFDDFFTSATEAGIRQARRGLIMSTRSTRTV